MDDFNFNSSYSSGWKRIKREETDKEQQKVFDVLQRSHCTLPQINKQAFENMTAISKKAAIAPSSVPVSEERHKEIIDKINQLQNEIATMKQILNNIQTNTEMIKAPGRKNPSGNKLSRFFK